MASDHLIKFDHHIEDYTEDRMSVLISDGKFLPAVERLLEDTKWQVDRESSRSPYNAPILSINNKTITPDFCRIHNGFTDPADIPASDYLTHDFSVENQFDKLTDIASRVVAACMEAREGDQHVLVWRGDPAITLTRQLHPKGLLLLITTSVAWI